MAATVCGFLLGYLAARATHNFGVPGLTPLAAVPRWALTGLLAAAFQTWVLGDVLPPRGRWLAVNTVAFAVAGVPAAIPSADPNSYGITWAIGGALIGIAQWLTFRRRSARPRWWPATTLIGFGLGGLIYGHGGELLPENINLRLASLTVWTAAGVGVSVVTGWAMARGGRA